MEEKGRRTARSKPSIDDPSVPQHTLPGHEHDTFHPKINKRSVLAAKAKAREGDDADVHSRLYKRATQSMVQRKEKIVRVCRALCGACCAVCCGGVWRVPGMWRGEIVTGVSSRLPLQTNKMRQFVNTNVDTDEGIDLGVAFHTDLETAAVAKTGLSTNSPAYFNVVTYGPELDFVVRRLKKMSGSL